MTEEDMFIDERTNSEPLIITKDGMVAIRRRLEFTQPQMAEHMGLSKSAYVAIETGVAQFRKIHALAAERVAMKWAHLLNKPTAIPYSVFVDLQTIASKWSDEALKEAQIAVANGKVG